jgi:hypothetical protein
MFNKKYQNKDYLDDIYKIEAFEIFKGYFLN